MHPCGILRGGRSTATALTVGACQVLANLNKALLKISKLFRTAQELDAAESLPAPITVRDQANDPHGAYGTNGTHARASVRWQVKAKALGEKLGKELSAAGQQARPPLPPTGLRPEAALRSKPRVVPHPLASQVTQALYTDTTLAQYAIDGDDDAWDAALAKNKVAAGALISVKADSKKRSSSGGKGTSSKKKKTPLDDEG